MIIIKQAPTNEFRLGMEEEGRQLYEVSSTSLEIPYVNGKFHHGLDPKDKETVEAFYGHQFDNPAHKEYWNNLIFEVNHSLNPIDMNNPEDVLKASILKVSGLAVNHHDELRDNPNSRVLFIIADEVKEEEQKASIYEETDKAITRILELRTKNKGYLIALARFLVKDVIGWGDNADLAYTKLREYIEGGHTVTKKQAVANFFQTLEMDKERLYVLNDVSQALRQNIIRRNSDAKLYNPLTGVVYGRNVEEAVDYLLKPENQQELGVGKDAPPSSIRKLLNK